MAEGEYLSKRWGSPELRLNARTPVPMWVQLARELRIRIVRWNLPAGCQLPTEAYLAGEYELSLDTVRQTYLAMLEGDFVFRQDEAYCVAGTDKVEYVTVPPGSEITAPAADPDEQEHIPWWAVIAIKVDSPGTEPVWYDATRTVLRVA